MSISSLRYLVTLLLAAAALAGCRQAGQEFDLAGQDVRLTLLQTSDIHSRILPYEMDPTYSDRNMGLDKTLGPFGGAARIHAILEEQREAAGRCLHIDSGDVFQGAPVFNEFSGEAEMRVISWLGADAMVLGNHEFDLGAVNLSEQLTRWKTFPMIAANYVFPDPETAKHELRHQIEPYTIFNLQGLKIGVVGMGDVGSITSLQDRKNSTGMFALDTFQTVQTYVDLLRARVHVLIVASHLGLQDDLELIRHTRGVDLVLGGHLHIVLDPPMVLSNADGEDVVLMHSGAFGKYVGRLDVVVRASPQGPGYSKVVAHRHTLLPVQRYREFGSVSATASSREACLADCEQECRQRGGDAFISAENPWPFYDCDCEDEGTCVLENASSGGMKKLLEEYGLGLTWRENFQRPVAFAVEKLKRFGTTGGDSVLGNIVAESLQRRYLVETDFAVTNSLGIRADIDPGPISVELMYNVFPFENTIVSLFLSGAEVQEMFDFVTRKSASRGCTTQAQVAGVCFTMNCATGVAEDIRFPRGGAACFDEQGNPDGEPLNPNGVYEVAVNDYMAGGGSGFSVLKANNTKKYTGIPMRDGVIDYYGSFPRCGEDENGDGEITLDELEGAVQSWIKGQPAELQEGLVVEYANVPCVRREPDGRIQRKLVAE